VTAPALPSVSASSFEHVRRLLRERAAIELGTDKLYLVNARLADLARDLQLPSAESVVRALEQNPADAELSRRVVEALTTRETFFFRDQHPFEALRREILPGLLRAKRGGRALRIWSAACSTGQEPYSLAITRSEQFADCPTPFEILATDLSTEALRQAREGRYRQHEISRGLPAALLAKYFEPRGTLWQARPELQRMIDFRQLNLAAPWPKLGSFDLVLLRNVLIYFSQATRRDVLARISQLLEPGGVLLLGTGESLLGIDVPLERFSCGATSLYRRR
jgi:chemotaxis protein methyltransferase CheR